MGAPAGPADGTTRPPQVQAQYVLFLGDRYLSALGTTVPLESARPSDRVRVTIPNTVGQWYNLKQPLALEYTAEEQQRTDDISRQMTTGIAINPNAGGGRFGGMEAAIQQITQALQQQPGAQERIIKLTEELMAI